MASRSLEYCKKYGTPNRRIKDYSWYYFMFFLILFGSIIYTTSVIATNMTEMNTMQITYFKPVIERKFPTTHPVQVFATVYTLRGKMANSKPVHEGAAACPRSWKLGTMFTLEGKWFTCEDHTSQRVEKLRSLPTVDIWHDWTYYQAKDWGAPVKVIYIK